MHYKTCEICGKRSGRSDGQKRIFMAKFPMNEDRCKQWVKATGKEDLVYIPIEKLHQLKHICGSHFLSKDFKKKKTQLRKNAVPSVGLSAEPLADELFVEFPLHIAKTDDNTELTSVFTKDHNYCGSWASNTPAPTTSTSEPMIARSMEKSKTFTAPSTSTAVPTIARSMEKSKTFTELTSVLSKDHNYCGSWPSNTPAPSTSTSELMIARSMEKSKTFTAPSTSTAEPTIARSMEKSKIFTAPSTSTAEPMIARPMEKSKTFTAPSTSTAEPTIARSMEKSKTLTAPSTSTAEPMIHRSKRRKIGFETESSTAKTAPTTPPQIKITKTEKLEFTPRKRKLLNKLRKSKILIKSLKKKVTQIENISSPVLKSLIESTVRNQKRKSKGRRWSKLNKSVALALYKKSPKAYRYLSQLLSMPSVRTLQTILENMKMEPGVDPCILSHLKAKAENVNDED